MPYLIDGHNLIHALPDIDLEDDHDEVKLVQRLRGFFGRINKKAEVIFDHGLPGGVNADLSNSQVKVAWAAAHHSNADAVIKRRVKKHRDPGQLIVVSSDHEVLNAAATRGARTMTSQQFADFMRETLAAAAEQDRSGDVQLSASEVDEWLRLFGGDPG